MINQCFNEVLFSTQSWFTLKLDTKRDLTGATFTRIKYRKPSYEVGYWEATVDGTVLEYDVQPGDIDEVGVWAFQAWVEMASREGLGEIFENEFYESL